MSSQEHWQKVYAEKDHKGVSWYADHIVESLSYIDKAKLPPTASIVDVGGGASTLVDDLLEKGFERVSVLDISQNALKVAAERLGSEAGRVKWIPSSVLEHPFQPEEIDLWHDRAVFHFLTAEQDREAYRTQLIKAVSKSGYFLISVFAEDGPERCSNLEIRRHSADELASFFGEAFGVITSGKSVHATPFGTNQSFVTVLMQKK